MHIMIFMIHVACLARVMELESWQLCIFSNGQFARKVSVGKSRATDAPRRKQEREYLHRCGFVYIP